MITADYDSYYLKIGRFSRATAIDGNLAFYKMPGSSQISSHKRDFICAAIFVAWAGCTSTVVG